MKELLDGFSVERLEQLADENTICKVSWDERIALARIALAVKQAEPDLSSLKRYDLDMSDCDSCGQDCGADMVEEPDGDYVLFADVEAIFAAPQPDFVIPEPATLSNINRLCPLDVNLSQTDFATGWNECRQSAITHGRVPPIVKGINANCQGWNAFRAAMLAAAPRQETSQ